MAFEHETPMYHTSHQAEQQQLSSVLLRRLTFLFNDHWLNERESRSPQGKLYKSVFRIFSPGSQCPVQSKLYGVL